MQLQLLVFVIGCSTALAKNYTHNDIIAAVDVTFRAVDANHDSILELDELLAAYDRVDFNKDHRVSEAEYEQRSQYHRFFGIVFMQLDHDGDGYLDRGAEFGQYLIMDTNSDNQVSRREYDVYYTKVIEDAVMNYGYLLATFPPHSNQGTTGVPTHQ